MSNLVQTEFFHVEARDGSLASLLVECFTKILDREQLAQTGIEPPLSGIKTVVRFHDHAGMMVSMVSEYTQANERADRILKKFFEESRWWKRRWLGYQHNRYHRRARKLQILCGHRAKYELLCRAPGEIAVELPDRSFRLIRPNEHHEVREAVRRAKNMWIFVFEPRGLCADNLKLIASSM